MANTKKWHYYVLVFTEEGPRYVTNILPQHTAEFKADKKPMEMSAGYDEYSIKWEKKGGKKDA